MKLARESLLLDCMLAQDRDCPTPKAPRGLCLVGPPIGLSGPGAHQIPPTLPSKQGSMMKMRQMPPTLNSPLTTPTWPLGLGLPCIMLFSQCPQLLPPPTKGSGASRAPPGFWGLQWLSNHLDTFHGRGHPPLQNLLSQQSVPTTGCVPDGIPGLPGIKVPRHLFVRGTLAATRPLLGLGSPCSPSFTLGGGGNRLLCVAQSWELGRGLGRAQHPCTRANPAAHVPSSGPWLPASACQAPP